MSSKGSTYETYAKEQLKIEDKDLQSLTDVPSLLQDLKNKKIDVVLIPDDVAKLQLINTMILKLVHLVQKMIQKQQVWLLSLKSKRW